MHTRNEPAVQTAMIDFLEARLSKAGDTITELQAALDHSERMQRAAIDAARHHRRDAEQARAGYQRVLKAALQHGVDTCRRAA